MASFRIAIGVVLTTAVAFGQNADFEAATIKPAPPMTAMAAQLQTGTARMGLTVTGDRVDIGFMSLADLIQNAYGVKPFQVEGPAWLRQERFDIAARLPRGASSAQVPAMLQTLLRDRFHLVLHKESREQRVYALVVAKGGPPLKAGVAPEPPRADAAAAGAQGSPAPDNSPRFEGRGGVAINSAQTGLTRMSTGPDGAMRIEMPGVTMAGLAEMLTRFMDLPVVDQTKVSGTYQVTLEMSREEAMQMAMTRATAAGIPGAAAAAMPAGAAVPRAPEPSGSGGMFDALERQGLKLERRNQAVDTLVIDSIERTPTAN